MAAAGPRGQRPTNRGPRISPGRTQAAGQRAVPSLGYRARGVSPPLRGVSSSTLSLGPMIRASLILLVLAHLTLVPADATADEPPPFDCPLCGSDPVLHERRMVNLARLDAWLVRTGLGRVLGR